MLRICYTAVALFFSSYIPSFTSSIAFHSPPLPALSSRYTDVRLLKKNQGVSRGLPRRAYTLPPRDEVHTRCRVYIPASCPPRETISLDVAAEAFSDLQGSSKRQYEDVEASSSSSKLSAAAEYHTFITEASRISTMMKNLQDDVINQLQHLIHLYNKMTSDVLTVEDKLSTEDAKGEGGGKANIPPSSGARRFPFEHKMIVTRMLSSLEDSAATLSANINTTISNLHHMVLPPLPQVSSHHKFKTSIWTSSSFSNIHTSLQALKEALLIFLSDAKKSTAEIQQDILETHNDVNLGFTSTYSFDDDDDDDEEKDDRDSKGVAYRRRRKHIDLIFK